MLGTTRQDFFSSPERGKKQTQGKGSEAVANRRVSMRKIKQTLRLHDDLGLGKRQIARSLSIAHSTVTNRAEAANLTWPLSENLSETG